MNESLSSAVVVSEAKKAPFSATSLGPINGIDYLVDYYALLGADPKASTEEIHSLFRQASTKWHPDKCASLAESLKEQATRQFKILRDADEILTDSSRRAHYDQLLAGFPSELISRDGTPILDLRRRRINLPLLLAGQELDVSATETKIVALSGHTEATFALIEQLYTATPSPNEQLQAAYRDALEKRHTYLTIREELEWQAFGFDNQTKVEGITSPEEHVSVRLDQLQQAKVEISAVAGSTMKLLGSAETVKLLGMGEASLESSEMSLEVARQQVIEKGIERITAISPRLVAAAEKTTEAMKALLEITKWYYCSQDAQANGYPTLGIAIVVNGKVVGAANCIVSGGDVSIDAGPPFQTSESKEEALAHFKSNLPPEVTGVVVEINCELGVAMQLVFVMQKHLEKIRGTSVVIERKA